MCWIPGSGFDVHSREEVFPHFPLFKASQTGSRAIAFLLTPRKVSRRCDVFHCLLGAKFIDRGINYFQ